MNFKDELRMKGLIKLYEKEKDGEWKPVSDFHNIITNDARYAIIDLMRGGTGISISHFGVGSGTTVETVTDTGLEQQVPITSVANPHKAFDSTEDNGTNLVYTCILTSTEPVTQPVVLSEIGLFSAISGGSLWTRATHTPYTKSNSVELKYVYQITIE